MDVKATKEAADHLADKGLRRKIGRKMQSGAQPWMDSHKGRGSSTALDNLAEISVLTLLPSLHTEPQLSRLWKG